MKNKGMMPAVLLFGAMVLPASTGTGSTQLGIRDGSFTVNGAPVFLLGFSYYGGLGASEQTVGKDLDAAQSFGFNWLRVWATWSAFGQDISAVRTNGTARQSLLTKLQGLVRECDRRALIVDVTLTRGETLPSFSAHEQAVETLVKALEAHGNWFLDLANEHDVRDGRFVSDAELKRLRGLVRRLDPSRLVTASFGGHDLTRQEVHEALLDIGLDFLAPHRPRSKQSASETEARTLELRTIMIELGRPTPILYQEPFRRGYDRWEPQVEDFLKDLKGARAGAAAGWCFHNGAQADGANQNPRRSFDLRQAPLFDQLDPVERQVIQKLRAAQAGSAQGLLNAR